MKITQISIDSEELITAATLVRDYIIEGSERSMNAAGICFAVTTELNAIIQELKEFSGTTGALFGAQFEGTLIGVGAFRDIGNGRAEMKRVYVAPAFRGKGVGRKLVTSIIDAARTAGFEKMMIESGTFLPEARKLYESLEFTEISPYEGSECGETLSKLLYYMEKSL